MSDTPTTDELVRLLRADEMGPAGINHAKTMRQHAGRLEAALRGLLYVIENDELVPESVSYMQEARAALEPPQPFKKRGAALPSGERSP